MRRAWQRPPPPPLHTGGVFTKPGLRAAHFLHTEGRGGGQITEG